MSKTDAIFVGVFIYATIATAFIWGSGNRENFGMFLLLAIVGIPIPFAIDKIWERLQ